MRYSRRRAASAFLLARVGREKLGPVTMNLPRRSASSGRTALRVALVALLALASGRVTAHASGTLRPAFRVGRDWKRSRPDVARFDSLDARGLHAAAFATLDS